MSSEVEICNLALQELGAKRITSLDDDTKNAKHCKAAYAKVRDIELRKYVWNFSIGRVVLAPDVATPAFDFDLQFSLPSDCLRVIRPKDVDWEVSGRKILTSEGTILNLKYVIQVTDTNQFDINYIDVLSKALALKLTEVITQSNTKKSALQAMYKDAVKEAKHANAFEKLSEEPPEDTWITARL